MPLRANAPLRARTVPCRRSRWRFALITAAAMLVAGASPSSRADDDLPGRVGRIAEVAGALYIAPEDRATEWDPIGLNYPIASGDNLWLSGNGRAEVDYGGGQFRFGGDTNLHVSRLDENQIALFIAQGRVIVRVRVLDTGDSARIDVPNSQIQLTRPGLYRIDVAPDHQSTTVIVREGEALVGIAQGSQQTLPGQTAIVTGPDPAYADIRNGVTQDDLDAWSLARDRRYERARATAYVSPQMVGYADLDAYGSWQSTPDYGPVWYPTAVAADWAPYRDGYWTNVGAWGFTWVDAAPWGYAPFHYGRWAWVRGRWGWCPGAFVARPRWAPALVGWVGGPGWGLSATFGSPVYGWVPLGWGEAFHPGWHGCSYTCWASYNRPYSVDVTSRPVNPPTHFRNADLPGAFTAVSGATLARHLPVGSNRVTVPTHLMPNAPVLAAAPAVVSGPLRIPGARPAAAGAPAPASTFYPVSRPGRVAAQSPARPGAPGTTTAATSPAMNRSSGALAAPLPTPLTRSAPLPAPTANANPSAPVRPDAVSRQKAPGAPPRVPSPSASSSGMSQSQPQAYAAPAPRPVTNRPPASERIGAMPQARAPAPPGVAVPGSAPMQRGVQAAPVAQMPAAAPHAEARVEHASPGRPAPPKLEPAPGAPAKP